MATREERRRELDDVLARRTRISIETFDRGLRAAEPAARLMGQVLGWSADDVRRQVEFYTARVEAERRSQQEPEDQAADAARRSAPDLITGAPAH